MRTLLTKIIEDLRSSYWFLPAIMAVGAMILAIALVQVDVTIGSDWLDKVPFLYVSLPDGARQVLVTIGGSMIGVAGTVFSVTMVAVVYASGQYGPRLLTNFLGDRGNQITLGTFTATFLYTIMVLRTIRSPDETADLAGGFVPNLAVFVAMILAICSIAVLIFFIHYIPTNIHISNVAAGIGKRLINDIDKQFPETLGRAVKDIDDVDEATIAMQVPPPFREDANPTDYDSYREILADRTGYIEFIDEETLFQAAKDHDVVLRLECRAGIFIHKGRPILDAWPIAHVDEELEAKLLASIAVGPRRTPHQDLLFQINELVEIAARALSPGVNDPFTAVTCIDWLGAALSEFAERRLPATWRVDDEARLRAIVPNTGFSDYLEQSLGSVRQYAAADVIASSHILSTLTQVAMACRNDDQIRAVRKEGKRLLDQCETAMGGADIENTRRKVDLLNAVLDNPRYRNLPTRLDDFLGEENA